MNKANDIRTNVLVNMGLLLCVYLTERKVLNYPKRPRALHGIVFLSVSA